MNETVLTLQNFRYLKIALALIFISIGIYVYHTPLGQPNGGTWVGFTLGIFGALLIVWLAWFGGCFDDLAGQIDDRFDLAGDDKHADRGDTDELRALGDHPDPAIRR
jgi:hypothetical protein